MKLVRIGQYLIGGVVFVMTTWSAIGSVALGIWSASWAGTAVVQVLLVGWAAMGVGWLWPEVCRPGRPGNGATILAVVLLVLMVAALVMDSALGIAAMLCAWCAVSVYQCCVYTVLGGNRLVKRVCAGRPIGKAVSPPPTLTVNVGSYCTEAAARQEAREFLHPNVFLYRSGMFPNPAAFGVAALVRNAVAVEVSGKKGSLYPWTVQIEFDAVGDAANVASWVHTLKSKIRAFNLS